jgi:hypothetical protein
LLTSGLLARGSKALAITAVVNERALESGNLMIEQVICLMNETDDRIRDNGGIFMAQPRRIRAKNIGLTRHGCAVGLITLNRDWHLP